MSSSADIMRQLTRTGDDGVLGTSAVNRGATLLAALLGFDEAFIKALEEDRAEQLFAESTGTGAIE
jgi:hypothetical protein